MRNVSKQFKSMLREDKRDYLLSADISLGTGETLHLTSADIWENGFVVDDATSNPASFDVGSVIMNKFILTINNIYDDFSKYDFVDAAVVAYVGLELPDGTIEKVRMGSYTVDEPSYNGSTITLECLDNIRKLDKSYAKSTLQYPATLLQIVRDTCECCGLSLNTKNFRHSEYTVEKRPEDEATTFREVMQWVAQIACKYVRCDAYGGIFLGWYDERDYVEEFVLADDRENKLHTESGEDIVIFAPPSVDPAVIGGGRFDKDNPYSSGDTLDGGLFNPWDNSVQYDAGTFDAMKTYHHIWSLLSMNVGTDDIRITGVSVSIENESGEGTKYLYGEQGYVLGVEKNGLIQNDSQAKSVAVMVGKKLVGMTFRTFDISHLSDPTLEAGDSAYVTDRKQNSYKTYITNTTFTAGGAQKSSCGAETPVRNQSERFSAVTKAIIESKKSTAKQISTYDQSVQMLTNLITQSFGVYKTAETVEDGSTIYYMHNLPTLEESDTIWKMTAQAFAVSTDGGKTWNAGMDSQGNAVVNVLSAIGIRFDWAKGGTLTLGGENNVSGVMQILDADGNVVGTFDKDGVNIIGRVKTRNDSNGFSVDVSDGRVSLYDYNGKKVGEIHMFKTTNVSTGGANYNIVITALGTKPAEIQLDGTSGRIYFDCDTLYMNGTKAQSGRIEFSNGTYIDVTNGSITNVKAANS